LGLISQTNYAIFSESKKVIFKFFSPGDGFLNWLSPLQYFLSNGFRSIFAEIHFATKSPAKTKLANLPIYSAKRGFEQNRRITSLL
jgi:hypothetical protein